MNKPEYVYAVKLINKDQVWIPYYYDFDNAVNKAIELIKEMDYPEDKIYSDNDGGGIEHFFVEGVEDPEDPELDIEPVCIVEYLVEDYWQ